MLIVVSGIKQSMLSFRDDGVVSQAAWDRIAQYKLELAQIDERDARALIKARIEPFARPSRASPR